MYISCKLAPLAALTAAAAPAPNAPPAKTAPPNPLKKHLLKRTDPLAQILIFFSLYRCNMHDDLNIYFKLGVSQSYFIKGMQHIRLHYTLYLLVLEN